MSEIKLLGVILWRKRRATLPPNLFISIFTPENLKLGNCAPEVTHVS